MKFAELRNRVIPKEDVAFGISGRAKEKIKELGKDKVIDATLGVLSDDDGKLIVLSSVDKCFKELKENEYAAYAPISGLVEYKEGIKKALFLDYIPKGEVAVSATPGGTGAIRNAISNYTNIDETILIQDWHWGPYDTISSEINRKTDTFKLFTNDGQFNIEDFKEKINSLLKTQKRLLVILNTPAHNPTGYTISDSTWEEIVSFLNTKEEKITLLLDTAYIDFAGDEKEVRKFFPIIEKLNNNILTLFAFSLSKTFTIYGLRAGAIVCLSKDKEIVDEFKMIMEFSSRGTWSNCNRAPQVMLSKVYADSNLKADIDLERKEIREMLLRRGKTFSKEASNVGLEIVPFSGGFFLAIPCDNPKELQTKLEERNIFVLPFKLGIRISLAAISEKTCKMLPKVIKEVMEK